MRDDFKSEEQINLIIEEIHKHFNENISLDDFMSVMKSNKNLRDVLCPSLG